MMPCEPISGMQDKTLEETLGKVIQEELQTQG
jgi:hypothetical protein